MKSMSRFFLILFSLAIFQIGNIQAQNTIPPEGSYIFISWEKTEGAASYYLELSDTEQFQIIRYSEIISNLNIRLKPDPQFKFGRVAAVDSRGVRGEYSDTFEVKTKVILPKPKKVEITNITVVKENSNTIYYKKQDKAKLEIITTKGKTTYYKLNNSSENFLLYTEPFYLPKEGLNTVQFYSVDNLSNREKTNTADLIADWTPPKIGVTIDPDYFKDPTHFTNGKGIIDVKITDSISGIETYRCFFVIDGAVRNLDSSLKYSMPQDYTNKTFLFVVQAIDKAGNESLHETTIIHKPQETVLSSKQSSQNLGTIQSNFSSGLDRIDFSSKNLTESLQKYFSDTSSIKILTPGEKKLK